MSTVGKTSDNHAIKPKFHINVLIGEHVLLFFCMSVVVCMFVCDFFSGILYVSMLFMKIRTYTIR